MDKLDLILQAVSTLDENVTKRLDDHETRLRSNERFIVKVKTLGGVVTLVVGFFSFDNLKQYWPFK